MLSCGRRCVGHLKHGLFTPSCEGLYPVREGLLTSLLMLFFQLKLLFIVIMYLSTIIMPGQEDSPQTVPDARPVLEPVIGRLLSSPSTVHGKVFYTQQVFEECLAPKEGCIVVNSWPEDVEQAGLGRVGDWATEHAQAISQQFDPSSSGAAQT